jgi:hypothetical protein
MFPSNYYHGYYILWQATAIINPFIVQKHEKRVVYPPTPNAKCTEQSFQKHVQQTLLIHSNFSFWRRQRVRENVTIVLNKNNFGRKTQVIKKTTE